jgi:hypothetical protein
MSHYLWARALAGQKKYTEAVPHAKIADELLNRNAVSLGAKQAGADAHQEFNEVQSKAAH